MLSEWTIYVKEATMNKEAEIVEQLKNNIKKCIPVDGLRFDFKSEFLSESGRLDFLADVFFGNRHFELAGEVITQMSTLVLQDKLAYLKSYVQRNRNLVPILVARYLSPANREQCKKAGIYFLDLSGNVFLQYESLYIERIGFPNRFPEIRKGRSPFSDKASLILRAMLKEGGRVWGVRELAESVNLDPGFVSRMARELEKRNYAVRKNSKMALRNPKAVLEDWVREYDYRKNQESRYFCLAKGPDEILKKLDNLNIPESINYALAFHAGASLISPHAMFNEVHLYVSDPKATDFFVNELGLKPVEQGANIILLIPYYKHSVFYGKQKVRNLWVVSDIQLYLDLYNYPLRGLEQAEHLYEKRLKMLIEKSELSGA
jgi:hypothetical protein